MIMEIYENVLSLLYQLVTLAAAQHRASPRTISFIYTHIVDWRVGKYDFVVHDMKKAEAEYERGT